MKISLYGLKPKLTILGMCPEVYHAKAELVPVIMKLVNEISYKSTQPLPPPGGGGYSLKRPIRGSFARKGRVFTSLSI